MLRARARIGNWDIRNKEVTKAYVCERLVDTLKITTNENRKKWELRVISPRCGGFKSHPARCKLEPTVTFK